MVTSTSGPFIAGWYRILDDHGVIAGPVPADTLDALRDFLDQTRRDWPGRIRELQVSAQQYGPWATVAAPPAT
jgi:hypothetical protein